MMQRESIQISVEGTIKGFKGMYSEIKNIVDGLRGWQKEIKGAAEMAKKLNVPLEELKRSMRAQGYLFRQSALATGNAARVTSAFGGVLKGVGTLFFKVARAGYNFIKSLKGFKPAWLSVMFMSMGIRKALGGMIKPVLELLGVFEIWRAMLVSLLLPALMPLYDMFLNLMDWFWDMPEGTQKLIGQFILVAASLATIAMIGSQFMLMITALGVSLGTIALILLPFAAIFGGVTIAVFKFGEEARATTDKIVDFINKGVEIAKKWLEGFVKKFMENLPLIKELSKNIMTALIDGILAILGIIGPVISTILDTMYEFFEAYKDKIFKIAGFIIEKLVEFAGMFLPSVIELGKVIIDKIMEGIRANKLVLKKAFAELLEVLTNIITESIPLLLQMGWTIGGAFLGGIWDFIKKNWYKVLFVGLMGLIGALAGATIGSLLGPAGAIAGAKIGGGIGLAAGVGTVGSFQKGGIVPETGPYTLHRGEMVTPVGGGAMTFNTTVHANVSSDYDVKRLASELSKEFSTSFERELKMRGSV